MDKITELEFIIDDLNDTKNFLRDTRKDCNLSNLEEEIYWQNVDFLNKRISHYYKELERRKHGE